MVPRGGKTGSGGSSTPHLVLPDGDSLVPVPCCVLSSSHSTPSKIVGIMKEQLCAKLR